MRTPRGRRRRAIALYYDVPHSTKKGNASFGDLFEAKQLEEYGVFAFRGETRLLDALRGAATERAPLARVYARSSSAGDRRHVVVVRSDGIRFESSGALLATTPSSSSSTSSSSSSKEETVAVVFEARGQFAAVNVSCQEFFARKRRLYAALAAAAAPDVRRDLRALDASLGGGTRLVIGLHVRVFDAAHDWPVVAPQPGEAHSSGRAVTWDDAAPVALHLDAARAALARHPRALLFVCSNDERVKHEAVRRFGADVAVAVDNSRFQRADARDNRDGVRAALLDWLTLGDAALVLHTFGSSFGEEAAAIKGMPSIRLRSGGHVLGVDSSRPYCNHPLFENADVQAAHTSEGADGEFDAARPLRCYAEAAAQGGADVCTRPLRRSKCHTAIAAWGIPDVYC